MGYLEKFGEQEVAAMRWYIRHQLKAEEIRKSEDPVRRQEIENFRRSLGLKPPRKTPPWEIFTENLYKERRIEGEISRKLEELAHQLHEEPEALAKLMVQYQAYQVTMLEANQVFEAETRHKAKASGNPKRIDYYSDKPSPMPEHEVHIEEIFERPAEGKPKADAQSDQSKSGIGPTRRINRYGGDAYQTK